MNLGRNLIPSLMVRDVEASVAFYRDLLGFELSGRFHDDEGLQWAEVRCGEIALQLGRGPICGLPEDPVFTGTLYFFPESVAAVEERVAGRVEIAWGPEEMPYGMRELAIRDPDGYLLAFSEPIDEDPECPQEEAEQRADTWEAGPLMAPRR